MQQFLDLVDQNAGTLSSTDGSMLPAAMDLADIHTEALSHVSTRMVTEANADCSTNNGEYYCSPFDDVPDMDETLTLPAISLQEPLASEVLHDNKTVESRGSDILAPLAGQLLAIRRGKQMWDSKRGKLLHAPRSFCPDGCIAGVTMVGSTYTKTEMVRMIGREAIASRVGLPYEAIQRYCTNLSTPMHLPSPLHYDGYLAPDKWKGLVWVTLSREHWGEEIWAAAHTRTIHVSKPE